MFNAICLWFLTHERRWKPVAFFAFFLFVVVSAMAFPELLWRLLDRPEYRWPLRIAGCLVGEVVLLVDLLMNTKRIRELGRTYWVVSWIISGVIGAVASLILGSITLYALVWWSGLHPESIAILAFAVGIAAWGLVRWGIHKVD